MSTNYYIVGNGCPSCMRYDTVTILHSAASWPALLYGPEDEVSNFIEWRKWVQRVASEPDMYVHLKKDQDPGLIYDEYGRRFSLEEVCIMIRAKQENWKKDHFQKYMLTDDFQDWERVSSDGYRMARALIG